MKKPSKPDVTRVEKCHIGNLVCWFIVIGAVSPILIFIMLKVV